MDKNTLQITYASYFVRRTADRHSLFMNMTSQSHINSEQYNSNLDRIQHHYSLPCQPQLYQLSIMTIKYDLQQPLLLIMIIVSPPAFLNMR